MNTAQLGLYLAVYIVVLLIAIVGGRVMPFFTEKALPGFTASRWPWIEALSYVGIIVFALADLILPGSLATALIALAVALIHAIRLYGWGCWKAWRNPMLRCTVPCLWLAGGRFCAVCIIYCWVHCQGAGVACVYCGRHRHVYAGHDGQGGSWAYWSADSGIEGYGCCFWPDFSCCRPAHLFGSGCGGRVCGCFRPDMEYGFPDIYSCIYTDTHQAPGRRASMLSHLQIVL